jgi:virulence factor Mce-like protein
MPNRGPRVNPALVGLVAAGSLFGLLFFAFTNVALFASNIDVKAQVATGATLAPNADVEISGVKVGIVKSIEKGNPGALVDMTIDSKKTTIFKDASLQIRPHGVFGPKFVAIDPGTASAGRFRDGDAIALANTRVSVDFEEVLNSLDSNTRQSLQTVLYELGTASQARGADFGTTLDKVNVVENQLTPVLQVVDDRAFNTGRLFESNAVVTETYADSPLDQIIHKNADVLLKLNRANGAVTGVVVHGNNVLTSLDTIVGGSNTAALSQSIAKLPTLLDNLQKFNNDLGYGVNALAPVVTPQHGQVDSDIGLAVRRTEDAFGQCDISDQSDPARGAADTLHANFIKIVPCYQADGRTPYVDPATGHVAHHHVAVLLGLHTQPAAPGVATLLSSPLAAGAIAALNNVLPSNSATTLLGSLNTENEGAVLCGPNSQNSSRPAGSAAFTCKTDPVQSQPIPGYGTAPPPLFSGVSGAGTSPVLSGLPTAAELPNTSTGRDGLFVAFVVAMAGAIGVGYWRARKA